MTTHIRRYFPVLAAAIGFAAGCKDDSRMADVHGEVTLNGKPLAEGSIRFEAVSGNAPTTGALIKDGRFSTKIPIGENKLEINAWEVVQPKTPGGEPSTRELLPAEYNEKSRLTISVAPGRNEVRYDLKGK